MNATRRKSLASIKARLEALASELETIIDEEQSYVDKMPAGIAAGAKGEKAQEVLDAIENAAGYLTTTIDGLDEVEA